jgi:hypothetical protein
MSLGFKQALCAATSMTGYEAEASHSFDLDSPMRLLGRAIKLRGIAIEFPSDYRLSETT